MNVFDLVSQSSAPQEEQKTTQAKRVCTYVTRFGTVCPFDAEPDALVCKAHGGRGGKMSLHAIRKHAIELGPTVLQRIEENILADDGIVSNQAAKLWIEISGVKDLPPMGSGLDEEELDAARRSLGRKLESVITHLQKRKTA